jgi:glycosidase
MRSGRTAHVLAAAAAAAMVAALPSAPARAEHVSAPAILQWFESTHGTQERRTGDLFAAGYGAVWTPPPFRSDSGNFSVGYDVYNRFDLGSAGNKTLYGTETGLKTLASTWDRAGVDLHVDFIINHAGFRHSGTSGFVAQGDYPGLVVTAPGAADGDFHTAFPPAGPDYEYQFRLSGLNDIDHRTNLQYVRNPVPGFANNIPGGTVADIPNENNRRFYPDRDASPVMVFDPTTGESNIPIYSFNTANPMAGDPIADNVTGYLMRNAQWLVQEIGVDGFRVDAARHVYPFALNYFDRGVFRANPRLLLDGSQKQVFSYLEAYTGDKAHLQSLTRKDFNPADPGRVAGNRDVLDFPLFFAMRDNLTGNGAANNWHRIRGASQDVNDDGLTNGSQGVAFVSSHDDGGPGESAYLSNVAHAFVLMRPGNAVVYFNAKEHGEGRAFPDDGRGDALGGVHGDTITTLTSLRNTHGRGDFRERWIDDAFNPNGFSNIYVYERENSAVVALNSRLDGGFDERVGVQTAFAPDARLVELTGNSADATVDPFNDIPDVITVDGQGKINVRIPRNKNASGIEHGKGYVIYGLQNPKGNVSVSNVARTLAPETPTAVTNGTARLTVVDIIKADSFNFTLNTSAVTLPDGFRDTDADGDNALLKVDGGVNVNGNAGVDYRTPGGVTYGFEEFVTQRTPGFGSATGNGTYVQTIDATQLAEGYHYLTARAFRRRTDGGPAISTDFRKTIYVDRLRPESAIVELKPYAPDARDVFVKSLDQTATGVHIFHNLGTNEFTDAQLVQKAANGELGASSEDRDLFKRGFGSLKDGNQVFTIVTFELSYDPALGYGGGGVNVQRFVGIPFASGAGAGLADLNFNDAYDIADVSLFGTALANNNNGYNPAADLSANGLIDESDNVLNVPWLVSKSASAGVINNATQLRLTRAMALDGTLNVPAGTLDVSGTSVPATPLTFNNSFNIAAGEMVTKTGGQALNINAPQAHGAGAILNVAQGVANLNTNGGPNLSVVARGGTTNFGVTQHLKLVRAGEGGTVTITPSAAGSGGKSLVVTELEIDGGKLDITNNNLIVNWAGGDDPYPSLLQAIRDGKNGFGWDGSHGITSSDAAAGEGITGVAIAPAALVRGLEGNETDLWAGQEIDSTTWLVKYTYAGDLNLDGLIDAQDYGIIDNWVQFPGAGGYFNGDINYDGVIDAADYGVIDNSIQLQGAPLFPPSAANTAAAFDVSVTAVPEPSSCAIASFLAGAALLRRKRHRKRSHSHPPPPGAMR